MVATMTRFLHCSPCLADKLRMMKEERARQRAENQTVAASAESNTAQLESERDTTLAELQDLRRQLAAVQADLDVANADTSRVMTANSNLQSALEVFQSEREAELAMREE